MKTSNHNGRRAGFTLLELSVVLLIIALLAAAVFVGQTMVRNSRLRSVLVEMQGYVQAMGAFQEKYQALPGDFAGATALWGTSAGGCNGGTGTGTCNGDGNGRITSQTAGTAFEEFRAWQHLAYAGMVQAGVSGAAGATFIRTVGTNIPSSQLIPAGWGLTSVYLSDAGVLNTDLPYVTGDMPPNHVLWFGGSSRTNSGNQQTGVIQPREAQAIDAKTDDGLANTGKIVAQINTVAVGITPCLDGSNQYVMTEDTAACALVFKTGF